MLRLPGRLVNKGMWGGMKMNVAVFRMWMRNVCINVDTAYYINSKEKKEQSNLRDGAQLRMVTVGYTQAGTDTSASLKNLQITILNKWSDRQLPVSV